MPRNHRTEGSDLAFNIGFNAKALRLTAHRTLANVASKAGISESMLSKVENGLALPSLPVFVRIAQALDVQPSTLLELVGEVL